MVCSLSIMVVFVNTHSFTARLYLIYLKRDQTVCIIRQKRNEVCSLDISNC